MSWKQKRIKDVSRFLLLLSVLLAMPIGVQAAQSNSTHYQVNEVFFGSGGELNACSNTYCSKQSAGELAVGNTASGNYQAQAGFNTNREPYLQFNVGVTNIALGTLKDDAAKTANTSFSVKAYLTHGYSVVNASDPPTNNSYTMKGINVPAASTPGTEQFGMNLAANNDPVVFGADPVHSPDNTFSYGLVTADYSQPNIYKYAKGDTVAYATSSSSATTYTISYLLNISPVTPGGSYYMDHVLVATATY